MGETREESCDYCEAGWVEGNPEPTPDGPHYPTSRCTMCDGHGRVDVELQPIDEDDLDMIEEGIRDDDRAR